MLIAGILLNLPKIFKVIPLCKKDDYTKYV